MAACSGAISRLGIEVGDICRRCACLGCYIKFFYDHRLNIIAFFAKGDISTIVNAGKIIIKYGNGNQNKNGIIIWK